MSEGALPLQAKPEKSALKSLASSTVYKVLRYTLRRSVALLFTVLIGVYLTILIANMGGYVDTIRRGQIREEVQLAVIRNPANRQLTQGQRNELIDAQVALREQRVGLDQPFAIRSVRYLVNAMTLNLGRSEEITSDSGSKQVRLIIMERLPSTLVLFATAQLLLFFLGLLFALSLSRQYGSFLDKLTIALAPASSAPAWFYGIFLILIFAAIFKVLPFGGMVAAPPPEDPLAYGLSLLKHMILPVSAWFISGIFLNSYNWRTFFLIYSSEDYVEMAKAKGLPDKMIERRYVLRPTLPTIITTFALTLINLWTGAIILETVFNWPGLGRLFYRAIGLYDTPVIVASTVIYAYLLALTVFILDFIYALVDPRVRVGEGEKRQ